MPDNGHGEYAQQIQRFKDASCAERLWVIYQESRTPLHTIKGYVHVLQHIKVAETQGLPENFIEVLERIREAEQTLSTLFELLALPEGQGGRDYRDDT
jgi:hypothetical protein